MGDLDRAQALCEESLALGRRLGDDDTIANGALNLGNLAAFRSDPGRSIELYQVALEAWRRTGNIDGQAFALCNLACTALYDEDDPDTAPAWFQQSLASRSELGDRRGMADCLAGLAGCAGKIGRTERSARPCGAAAALRTGIGAWIIPQMQALEDGISISIRAAMGGEAFAAAFAAGAALSPDDAVAEALARSDP
jgi:tetratricopeptide (TPR) repeat protein